MPLPAKSLAFIAKGKTGLRRKMDEMRAICQLFPGVKIHQVGSIVRDEAFRVARYLELES